MAQIRSSARSRGGNGAHGFYAIVAEKRIGVLVRSGQMVDELALFSVGHPCRDDLGSVRAQIVDDEKGPAPQPRAADKKRRDAPAVTAPS